MYILWIEMTILVINKKANSESWLLKNMFKNYLMDLDKLEHYKTLHIGS
jgi:hypothetical protein